MSFPVHGRKSLARRPQLYRGRHATHPSEPVDVPPALLMTTTTTTTTTTTPMIMMVMTSRQSLALIALLSLLLLLLAEANCSITPEDIRFGTARCQNDSTDDPATRLQWSMRMFPDNHETHCYVKCLLSKLGLINLKYRGLNGNKLIQPLEIRDIEITEECYNQLEDFLSGTCQSYYRKWMDLRKSCKEFFYISLFEDPKEVDKFNKKNSSQSKNLGETASEFCGRDSPESESKELTSAQTAGDDILTLFKCELECLFRHIRYFDAYGRIDELEIQRSFREFKSDSKDNFKVLSKCVHRSNALFSIGPCQMAYELYQCLLKKVNNFREVYTQRDKISRYY